MDGFSMWERKIVFKDGWFIYRDEYGNNSIISHKRAREIEMQYQDYQAYMDVSRGGMPEDAAYKGRGFEVENGRYVYKKYKVDKLINKEVREITKIMQIPETVFGILINSVAERAFFEEEIIEKTILHDNIKEIGKSAFEGCINLSEVVMKNDRVTVKTDAFKNTKILTEEATYTNKSLIKVNKNISGVFEVKEGTTTIADNAFCDCKKITKVILPKELKVIGECCFMNCESLKEVVFPKEMKSIKMAAFRGCISLSSIILPNGIEEMPRFLFEDCENLEEVYIPDSVKNIRFDTFKNCKIYEKYKDSLEDELYIGKWLIHYKPELKESISIREGTVGIADIGRMDVNRLRSVKLTDTLKYMGSNAFCGAQITNVSLPGGLCHIGSDAFRRTKLKTAVIPENVDKIGKWAFMDCEDIEEFVFLGKDTEIEWPAITGRRDNRQIKIYAKKGSKAEAYCNKYAQEYNLKFIC